MTNKPNFATDLLSAMFVQAYTADVKKGGNPSLENIAKYFQKDFKTFAKDKHNAEIASLDWGHYAGPAYDSAICTLIETGMLRN